MRQRSKHRGEPGGVPERKAITMTNPSVTRVRRLRSNTFAASLAMSAALVGADGVLAGGSVENTAIAVEASTTAVETVALVADGQISGCAVQARFDIDSGDIANVRFALLKDPSKAAGTRFALSAALAGTDGATRHIEALSLTTASANTSPTFSQPVDSSEGTFSVSGTFDDLQGGSVMRDLMLRGADIRMSATGRAPLVLKIIGPLSASARAAYLQCAGDLFRPQATSPTR